MQDTPKANRLHIALFGRTNAGKSSLINALTGQNLAIVSHMPGTTTDPVSKAMEILPVGPVLLIDTAGLDDKTELGQLRMEKSIEVLKKTDIALVILDAMKLDNLDVEQEIIEKIKEKKIPYLVVLNKVDLNTSAMWHDLSVLADSKYIVSVSANKTIGIDALKQLIARIGQSKNKDIGLLDGLIKPNDIVLLITPIDSAAPKDRMILPQVQVLRAALDNDAVCITVKEEQLLKTLSILKEPPALAITDSQAFKGVDAKLPTGIPLTSFSILFARQKGDLSELTIGAQSVSKLKNGDKILIVEACTHYRTHEDIGTVKIPNMLLKYTGLDLEFNHVAGYEFSEDIKQYALIVHCGACMINRSNMMSRIEKSKEYNVPIVNYGVLIAYLTGILNRSLKPFN